MSKPLVIGIPRAKIETLIRRLAKSEAVCRVAPATWTDLEVADAYADVREALQAILAEAKGEG